MSVVDILDRAAALYRANFRLLFGIAFLAGASYFVLQQVVFLTTKTPQLANLPGGEKMAQFAPFFRAYAAMSGLGIVAWVFNLWSAAALVYAVSRRHMGLAVNLREAIRNTLGRLPYFIVTTLVMSIVMGIAGAGVAITVMGVTMLVALLVKGSLGFGLLAAFAATVGGTAILLVALAWVLGLWLHPATVVVEQLGIGAALHRSRDLMRQRFAVAFRDRNDVRLTVAISVVPLLGFAAASIAFLPVAVAGLVAFLLHWVDASSGPSVAALAMSPVLLVQTAAIAVTQPYTVAVTVLFYYDLRYRTEGLDLELWAASLRTPRSPRGS